MNQPGPDLLVALTGLGGCLWCLVAFYRHRHWTSLASKAMMSTIEAHDGVCREEFERLRQSMQELELGLQKPEQVLGERRLSRSSRANALHLLRTGLTAESAAAKLGMPQRDVRLLAKVAACFRTA